jgi:hypothetical protein
MLDMKDAELRASEAAAAEARVAAAAPRPFARRRKPEQHNVKEFSNSAWKDVSPIPTSSGKFHSILHCICLLYVLFLMFYGVVRKSVQQSTTDPVVVPRRKLHLSLPRTEDKTIPTTSVEEFRTTTTSERDKPLEMMAGSNSESSSSEESQQTVDK